MRGALLVRCVLVSHTPTRHEAPAVKLSPLRSKRAWSVFGNNEGCLALPVAFLPPALFWTRARNHSRAASELGVPWVTREGNGVADVLRGRHVAHKTLEAQPVAAVGRAPVPVPHSAGRRQSGPTRPPPPIPHFMCGRAGCVPSAEPAAGRGATRGEGQG